jgi:protocatechuate 3,4-dioxygenase, beta subunit
LVRWKNILSDIIGYRRPAPGTQPDYLYLPYVSSQKRAPTQPLVMLPHTLTEITGPVFGERDVAPGDHDLFQQHTGVPQGERIIARFPIR